MSNFMISQLDQAEGVSCPCGTAQRAFADPLSNVASVHLVTISENSKAHYHKKMTEIYIVLEGEGEIELDGQRYPLKPMTAVYIKPGCRHRAVGRLKLINVPIPAFDPADEWHD